MKKKTTPITPDVTIASLLSRWPQLIPIFLKHGMSCVGCSMAAFESLEDAARIYGLNYDLLSDEIQKTLEEGYISALQKPPE